MWTMRQAFAIGLVLLSVALCVSATSSAFHDDEDRNVEEASQARKRFHLFKEKRNIRNAQGQLSDDINTNIGHHRDKRGWGSVIFIGTTLALRATSVGLNLAQALSEGCLYYPSICEDKAVIERIEKETKALASEYDNEYIQSKVVFLALRKANNNNAYINYYINSTLREIEKLNETQKSILDEMEIELPELFKIFQASSENVSAKVYIQSLLGHVEFVLSDIREMISAEKHNALVGLAIQFSIEAVVGRFIANYQKAYNYLRILEKEDILSTTYFSLLFSSDPTESGILLDPNHPLRDELIDAKLKAHDAKSDFKMAPKVLKRMVASTFIEKPKSAYNAMKKWGRIRSWEGFKGKFMHSISGSLEKFGKLKQFITNSEFRKFTISKYKAPWSVKIMAGIGVILDAVAQGISAAQWKQVANQISESRQKYEEFKTNLEIELRTIKAEKSKLDGFWVDVIDTFRNISVSFKSFVQNATQYSNFSDVIGNPGLPVNLSNPLFNTDFDNLHRSSLEEKQNAVIGFLVEVENNMTRITDKLRSRRTLYSVVLSETSRNQSALDILSSAQIAFRHDVSQTVVSYGASIDEKDIVCSIAILRPTRPTYEYLSLVPFRPSCQVNSSAFEDLKRDAEDQQFNAKLFKSVKRYVIVLMGAMMESLGLVRDLVIGDVGQGNSSNISEDDILCAIAHEFPNKQSYDGRSLLSYRSRPECTQI